MAKIRHDDMRRILGMLPKDVLNMMKDNQLFLAGGYIRASIAGEKVSDIDLLCANYNTAKLCATALRGEREARIYRTKNAYTILQQGRTPVQFIHRWTFDNAPDLLASFDFTIAQACMWFENGKWHSLTSEHFYPDLAARRLRYEFPIRHEDAGGSLLRVQKFLKRGYDIAPEEMGKVIARLISKVEAGSMFWRGGEANQGIILAALLREVDPLTIIDGLQPDDASLENTPPEEELA